MRPSVLFREVLQIVSEETEIPSERILSNSHEPDVVDARYLFIYTLLASGIYPTKVAAMANRSSRSVNYIYTTFDIRKRQSPFLRIIYERVMKKIGSISAT